MVDTGPSYEYTNPDGDSIDFFSEDDEINVAVYTADDACSIPNSEIPRLISALQNHLKGKV
jgi:hypothetical protein